MMQIRRRNVTAIGTYTVLVFAVAVAMFPILWILLTSFKTPQEALRIPLQWFPSKFTFASYTALFREWSFNLYFINSAIVTTGTTICSIAIATAAGYGFSRFKFKGNRSLLMFILMTTMFPAVMLVIPYFMILRTLGLLNKYIGYIWAYTSFSLPFCTWMMKGYFDSVPREIDEAGIVDGCSVFGVFLKLCVPIAAPGMAATAIFSFLLAWNQYIFALALTTRPEMYMIPVGIATLIGEYWTDWSVLTAGAVVTIAPVIVFNIFLERYLVAGMAAGAVKG
jgi:multiple sugar transport system permease protein